MYILNWMWKRVARHFRNEFKMWNGWSAKMTATTYFRLTPYMSKSDYELEEGHQGQSSIRPCHSIWSMLLQNGVLSLLSSRDNRVLSYTILPDMFLKTIALFSLTIIQVNSLFSNLISVPYLVRLNILATKPYSVRSRNSIKEPLSIRSSNALAMPYLMHWLIDVLNMVLVSSRHDHIQW